MQICIQHVYNISQYIKMQLGDEKNLQFIKAVGRVIRRLREERTGNSCQKFAYEYDLKQCNLSRIENGKHNAAFYFIWGISEALGMKFSDFAKLIEEELGENFSLIDK